MSKPAKPIPLSNLSAGVAEVKAGSSPYDAYIRAIGADVTLAAFTERELQTLRNVLRDADNEMGLKAFNAGLARGGK